MCEFRAKIPAFYCSLQRRFAHIQREKFYSKGFSRLRDRSFFMREGGLVGFGGGGALEKNWLERGGQPKKNEGKGGGVGRKN